MKTFQEFLKEDIDPTVVDRKYIDPLKPSRGECKKFECEKGKTVCMNCGKKENEHKIDPTVADRKYIHPLKSKVE
jgi:hypothetical protein